MHEIIFEAETPAGKLFDVVLLVLILLSVLTVVLESVAVVEERYASEMRVLDLVFTVLFTVEYALRVLCVKRTSRRFEIAVGPRVGISKSVELPLRFWIAHNEHVSRSR